MQRCGRCKHLKEDTDFEVYKDIRRKTCISCLADRINRNKNKNQCYKCNEVYHKSEIHQMTRVCYDCVKKCEHGNTIHCKDCKRKAQGKTNEYKRITRCEHNHRKDHCRTCNPNAKNYGKCEHGDFRYRCKECSPQMVIVNLIRKQVRRCFNCSTLEKINHSIEYLGCDVDTLRIHIKSKMTAVMTLDNIHYDHIKPVSRFDLDDEDEFLKCCHFTNLQPLLAADNLRLKNTWTEENEVFWNEHILYKPDFKDLYKV